MTEANRKPGRPRKGDQIKSETLAIKTSPALKTRLALEAERNHRSLTEEVETRLTESLNRSDIPRTERTALLLEEIARNIFEIEMAIGEGDEPLRWHENIAAWAAVREMLYYGPINAVATGAAFRVEKLERLTDEAAQIREAKVELVGWLGQMGIGADINRGPLTLGDKIRGATTAPNRDKSREEVNRKEGLSDENREAALAAIDALEQLDEAQDRNAEARDEAVEFLREGIERGRATYIKPRLDPALSHAIELLQKVSLRDNPFYMALAGKPPRPPSALLQPQKPRGAGALSSLFTPTTKRDDDSGPASDNAG